MACVEIYFEISLRAAFLCAKPLRPDPFVEVKMKDKPHSERTTDGKEQSSSARWSDFVHAFRWSPFVSRPHFSIRSNGNRLASLSTSFNPS